MSIFSKFPPKEKLISRTYEIDLTLYEKLEHLSTTTYDVSINKLVNTCLEHLLSTKNIALYKRNRNEISVFRTFLIRQSLLEGLYKLKTEYNISLTKLVNIAIYDALIDEGILKK